MRQMGDVESNMARCKRCRHGENWEFIDPDGPLLHHDYVVSEAEMTFYTTTTTTTTTTTVD
jgi:hypothetical protein